MADQATKIYQELNSLTKQVTESTKAYANVLKGLVDQETQSVAIGKQSIQTLRDLIKAQDSFAKNTKAVEQAERELIKTETLRRTEQEKVNRAMIQTAKAQNTVKKSANDLNGAYRNASKELTTARNKAKDLAVQYGVTSKQFRQAANDVRVLDANLKKIDSAVGQNQRSVGNYGKALGGLKSLLGAAGVLGGVQLLANGLKSTINVFKDYEKRNAELAGVLGKTRKETKLLQDDSKRLGASTAFSATQVTELQLELARLGKSEAEIIASTEGIINATIALGSETGETAALVGSTLNAFKLGAEESTRVADILTLSTQRSALSFEKLNTALPTVAGAASAVGVSLEQLVSQLGQAADRGIDASTAATSLRNIYIRLKSQGLTYAEALDEINKSSDKVTTSVKLFGVRASVTGLALADTIVKAGELTTALENAGGTAKRVADEQLNTLDGRIKLLTSAWEGFVLSFQSSEGIFQGVINGVIVSATNLLTFFSNIGGSLKATFSDLKTADDNLLNLIVNTGKLSKTGETARDIFNDLKGRFEEVGLSGDNLAMALRRQLPDALEYAGESAENAAIFTEFLIKQYGELATKAQLAAEANEELAESNVEVVEVETDLIKIQEELLKQARELPGTTQQEIAFRTAKIDKINEEITRLKELGKEQDLIYGKGQVDLLAANQIEGIDKVEERANKEFQGWVTREAERTAKLRREIAEREELDRAYAETKVALEDAGFESAGILSDQFFANSQMRRDEETQAQIDAMNQRLENDTLDAEQRELIQKQIAEKEKKLKTDQAKADKKAAIIQSVVNTALAIGKTAATLGFPAAIPFIAFAAATGLAQTIAIASQPLPKFDKGTKNFPGLGEVAERRPELVVNRGVTELFTKPTILGSDYKGAEIIGGADTAKLLDQANRAQLVNGVSKNSSKIDTLQMELSFEKMMDKHTNRMVNELRKNRPIKQSANDYRADYSRNKYGA